MYNSIKYGIIFKFTVQIMKFFLCYNDDDFYFLHFPDGITFNNRGKSVFVVELSTTLSRD